MASQPGTDVQMSEITFARPDLNGSTTKKKAYENASTQESMDNMRYVRKQISIQVIADEIVEDIATIKGILQTFQKAKTDVSISYRRDYLPTTHERVRVILVADETFDITIIATTSSMTIRKIPISSVDYLCSTVSPSEVFIKKDGVNKGDTLDMT